jgi:hypothetical protein
MTVYVVEAIRPDNGARMCVGVYASKDGAAAKVERATRRSEGRQDSAGDLLGVVFAVTEWPVTP